MKKWNVTERESRGMGRRRARMWQAALALAAMAWGCGGSGSGPSPTESAKPSAAAVSYMTAALDIMQAHSIRRHEIDWESFRSGAMRSMGDAQTTSDTYPALRQTITALGDHHSFLIAPSDASALIARSNVSTFVAPSSGSTLIASSNVSTLMAPSNVSAQGLPFGTGITAIDAQLLPPGIGYIYIPGTDDQGSDATAFADALQEAVENLDSSDPCGWVVDLRQNVGGNMWPMIAGIGPVLGEGDLGSFVDPDSVRSIWYYADGAAGMRFPSGQKSVAAAVSDTAYKLAAVEPPPVAVLYGPYTASSGEALAIAFRGRSLSRSFGEPTSGLSTANATYPLSDGALLVLTVATDVDRTGQIYGGELQPDQPVSWTTIEPTSVYDTAAAQAKEWLLAQSACEDVAG